MASILREQDSGRDLLLGIFGKVSVFLVLPDTLLDVVASLEVSVLLFLHFLLLI